MNIFIGCSARSIIPKDEFDSCSKLITEVAKIPNLDLVFGAYYKGLMTVCYDEFKANNKRVLGATPKIYEECLNEMNCDDVVITDTTMERFNEIYKVSDIFLILPGGLGTLTELFNAIEENRTNNHNKKIIIYNKNYFYTPIIQGLYKMYENKYIDEPLTNYFVIESDEDKIIELIKKEID